MSASPRPWTYNPNTRKVYGYDDRVICELLDDMREANRADEAARCNANGWLIVGSTAALAAMDAAVLAWWEEHKDDSTGYLTGFEDEPLYPEMPPFVAHALARKGAG